MGLRTALSKIRHNRRKQQHVRGLRASGAWIAPESVTIDAESRLAPGTRVAHHASLRASSLGAYTSVGRFSKLAFVKTGPFCSISWDATVGAVGHPLDRVSTHAFPYAPEAGGFVTDRHQHVEPLTLGADVWVGANAVVMPGLTIGNGAVIGAGAVVTKNVDPYTVVGGVPARPIGQRFPEALAERLDALAWWDWPHARLEAAAAMFREPLTEASLAKLEALAP